MADEVPVTDRLHTECHGDSLRSHYNCS